MNEVYVYLIEGFEEIEALATVDVLRRGGVSVKTVSLMGERTVVGSHAVPVVADLLFEEADTAKARMLVVPGGTVKFNEHEGLKAQLLAFAKDGKPVAAICASPAVLGGLGLLDGRNAVCYPGFEEKLNGATFVNRSVVIDGNITTGKGPGLTIDFALSLLEQLEGKEVRMATAKGLLVQ